MQDSRLCGHQTFGAPSPCNKRRGHRGNHEHTSTFNGQTNTMSWARTWLYRGVTIERAHGTGYYVARSCRALTADTLEGMRALIREYPA